MTSGPPSNCIFLYFYSLYWLLNKFEWNCTLLFVGVVYIVNIILIVSRSFYYIFLHLLFPRKPREFVEVQTLKQPDYSLLQNVTTELHTTELCSKFKYLWNCRKLSNNYLRGWPSIDLAMLSEAIQLYCTWTEFTSFWEVKLIFRFVVKNVGWSFNQVYKSNHRHQSSVVSCIAALRILWVFLQTVAISH